MRVLNKGGLRSNHQSVLRLRHRSCSLPAVNMRGTRLKTSPNTPGAQSWTEFRGRRPRRHPMAQPHEWPTLATPSANTSRSVDAQIRFFAQPPTHSDGMRAPTRTCVSQPFFSHSVSPPIATAALILGTGRASSALCPFFVSLHLFQAIAMGFIKDKIVAPLAGEAAKHTSPGVGHKAVDALGPDKARSPLPCRV